MASLMIFFKPCLCIFKQREIYIFPRKTSIEHDALLRENKSSHSKLDNFQCKYPIYKACVQAQAISLNLLNKKMHRLTFLLSIQIKCLYNLARINNACKRVSSFFMGLIVLFSACL